jgi:hypothetical protein
MQINDKKDAHDVLMNKDLVNGQNMLDGFLYYYVLSWISFNQYPSNNNLYFYVKVSENGFEAKTKVDIRFSSSFALHKNSYIKVLREDSKLNIDLNFNMVLSGHAVNNGKVKNVVDNEQGALPKAADMTATNDSMCYSHYNEDNEFDRLVVPYYIDLPTLNNLPAYKDEYNGLFTYFSCE